MPHNVDWRLAKNVFQIMFMLIKTLITMKDLRRFLRILHKIL